jgi:VanZ family protein
VAHRRALNPSVNPPIPLWLRTFAWLAVAAWAGTIYFFSSMSGPEIEKLGVEVWDKAAHFAAFACGGVLLALALRWSVSWPWKKLARFAIVALAIYGAFDEIHQLFTPHRSGADLFDWLADCLGALAGTLLFVVIYGRFIRAHHSAPAGA